MRAILIAFVRLWRRFVSPLYGDVCKFHPTCSAYGLRALEVHGAAKGSWLTVSRIARCHPWSEGGYDPVPGTPEAMAWERDQAVTTTVGPIRTVDDGTDPAPPSLSDTSAAPAADDRGAAA